MPQRADPPMPAFGTQTRRTLLAAVLAAVVIVSGLVLALTPPAAAQAPDKPVQPTACVEGSEAASERMIADCDALLADKATADEKIAGLHRARAEASIRQGRLQPAIDDLGQAIARKADDARSILKRAELRQTLGDADGAIADLSAAIRLAPDNAKALFARGELFRGKGDRRRALSDFVSVLRLDSAHEAAGVNRKELALEIEKLGALMPVEKSSRR